MSPGGHVVALCGGVGGAKLAFGLVRTLAADRLSIVCNTGDDFEHLGLHVAPDIDTVVYTLSGMSDRERGWGLAGETWSFMDQVQRLGGAGWFNLGDRDLAMHVERTRRLRSGEPLTAVTRALSGALGIEHSLLPMSDDPVRTRVETDAGDLAFQEYFVRERCAPVVRRIYFQGAEAARLNPAVAAALARNDLAAIIVCPSNPYLSIDPILAVPGMREALVASKAPVVAVSPIVGGEAIKGPTAKLMRELGVDPSGLSVARHYRGWLNGLIIDQVDAADAAALEDEGLKVLMTGTVMQSDDDRTRLAREALAFAATLGAAA
jgi:LPPG:FO 2-phospho-L-lactate transferase